MGARDITESFLASKQDHNSPQCFNFCFQDEILTQEELIKKKKLPKRFASEDFNCSGVGSPLNNLNSSSADDLK